MISRSELWLRRWALLLSLFRAAQLWLVMSIPPHECDLAILKSVLQKL